MSASPHEYLSWQQFAGIVRPDPYHREDEHRGAISHTTDTWRSVLLRAADERIGSFYRQPKAVPSVSAAAVPSSRNAWELVTGAISTGERGWAQGPPLPDWDESASDDEYVSWFRPMPDYGDGLALVSALQNPDTAPADLASRFPRWLAFESAGQIDLTSVPWAWWGALRNADEEISFLYDRIRPASGSSTSGHLTLSVYDRRWFALLEFLAAGRLDRAGEMFDTVRHQDELFEIPNQALQGKVKGPLVATAGAIVLIGRAASSEQTTWDAWLENLCEWFPGVPDGAILLGCRRADQARTMNAQKDALAHLKKGVARGIPFFSATIRMLDMSLARLGSDLEQADELRSFIAPVVTHVDPGQPFTVIRL